MGAHETGFVHVEGLESRIKKAEAEDNHWNSFFARYLSWSKEKRQRFWNRWNRWLLYKLNKPAVPDFDGYEARRRFSIWQRRQRQLHRER